MGYSPGTRIQRMVYISFHSPSEPDSYGSSTARRRTFAAVLLVGARLYAGGVRRDVRADENIRRGHSGMSLTATTNAHERADSAKALWTHSMPSMALSMKPASGGVCAMSVWKFCRRRASRRTRNTPVRGRRRLIITDRLVSGCSASHLAIPS